jgi:hypothetical protein
MISGNTGSDLAAAQISQWIQTCSDSHERCQGASEPQILPSRVLEILAPRTVRLKITSENEAAQYTTLSYAWGKTTFIQTTSSTLLDHQNSIPWDALPKTFQDAVQVTLRLGLRYIWIDSLCIVQNDDGDWRKEGSRMASIYSRSFLTIAATKSSNPKGGCFVVSSPGCVGRTYELRDSDNVIYNIGSRDALDHTGNTGRFPLLQRAWVFQERLLSARMLHFGPEEMLWECMSCTACECSSWIMSRHEDKTLPPWEPLDSPRTNPFTQGWHYTIAEYSHKNLTFDTDIFPALQGVAKRVQEQRKCSYYAGLWEDSLLEDLLWNRSFPGITTQWRAPSWSWASGDGIVRWEHVEAEYRFYYSVLEISTKPVGIDRLSALKGGELKLTGPCVITTIRPSEEKPDSSYALRPISHLMLRWDGPMWQFYPDLKDTCSLSADVPVVLMKAARRRKQYVNYDFLVFKEVDGTPDVYERVGLATLYGTYSWEKRHMFLCKFDWAAKDMTITVI